MYLNGNSGCLVVVVIANMGVVGHFKYLKVNPLGDDVRKIGVLDHVRN